MSKKDINGVKPFMRIKIRRRGRTVYLKCEGDFPRYENRELNYIADHFPLPPHSSTSVIWFGDGEKERTYDDEAKAIQVFQRCKVAAKNYKEQLKRLRRMYERDKI